MSRLATCVWTYIRAYPRPWYPIRAALSTKEQVIVLNRVPIVYEAGMYRKAPPARPLMICLRLGERSGGGDTTVLSSGRSPKQPLLGIGLHDPLYGRQACPEFNLFHQGVGQMSPREGLLSFRPLPKRRQICDIPAPNRCTTLTARSVMPH